MLQFFVCRAACWASCAGRLRAQVLCDFAGGSLSLFQLCLEVRTPPQRPPECGPPDVAETACCVSTRQQAEDCSSRSRQAPESGPGFRVVATADLAAMSQFVQVLLAGRRLDCYLACGVATHLKQAYTS